MAVKEATAGTEAAKTATVEEQTTKAETAVKAANTKPETVKLVYIGPALPKAMLKTNRIFEGTEAEIKKELADVLEKFPLVEKMLVPVAGLAEKKDKVKTAGNILNKYYADLVSSAAAAVEKEV